MNRTPKPYALLSISTCCLSLAKEVSAITKAELLSFRSALGKVPGQKGQSLTATRINHIMTPLRMILSEAADRFEFTSPYLNIKSLKVPKTDVEPFTLDEVLQILGAVREDFRNYYTVRFSPECVQPKLMVCSGSTSTFSVGRF